MEKLILQVERKNKFNVRVKYCIHTIEFGIKILAPMVNMSKKWCKNVSAWFLFLIFHFRKFTKIQCFIEVKQLKVGGNHIFFSNTLWPQLLGPLHFIPFASSICKKNRSEISLITSDEVEEQMTSNLILFFNTSFLQFLPKLVLSLLQFILLIFYRVQVSEVWTLILCSVWHCFVDFDICFEPVC